MVISLGPVGSTASLFFIFSQEYGLSMTFAIIVKATWDVKVVVNRGGLLLRKFAFCNVRLGLVGLVRLCGSKCVSASLNIILNLFYIEISIFLLQK